MVVGKATEREGKGFKIIYQILATMLIIALIPLGGLYYISIYKSRQEWTDKITRRLVENTEGLARAVEDWTNMNLMILQQNSTLPAMQSMDAVQQNPVLQSITKTYTSIYLAHTILPDGQNIGRSDGQNLLYYGDREYFKQVLAGKPMGQQVLIGKTSKKPALTLAAPIRGDSSKILGVTAVAMTLEELSKTVTKTKIGETGFAILLDDQNRLIAHGKGAIASELQDFSFHPALKRNTQLDDPMVFTGEDKQIVAYTQKTTLGWTLIVQQDYKEAYAAANEAQRNALFLLFITLSAVIGVACLLASRLSTPIRNLTVIADEISRGKLDAVIKEKGRSDEIGALARAIDRMGVSLQMAFDRIRKR